VSGQGHPEFIALVEDLRALHLLKSGGYGTGADPFGNFTAVASLTGQPRYLYAVHRSIEKLTRVLSLHAQGRVGELEEEFMDVAGLMVCASAMLREDGLVDPRDGERNGGEDRCEHDRAPVEAARDA
jgi:hypothetical protein